MYYMNTDTCFMHTNVSSYIILFDRIHIYLYAYTYTCEAISE